MIHSKHRAPLLRLGEGIARRRKFYLVTMGKAPRQHVVPIGSVLRLTGRSTSQIRKLLAHFKVFCNYRLGGAPRYVKSLNFPVAPGDRVGVDGVLYAVGVDPKGGLQVAPTELATVTLRILKRIRIKGGRTAAVCSKGYVVPTEESGHFVQLSPEGFRVIDAIEPRPCCLFRKFLKQPIVSDGLEPSYIL